MGGFRYKKQDWTEYNSDLTLDTNIEIGGVATPEKLEHIEEGIYKANLPIAISLQYSETEITNEEIVDDVRYIDIYTPNIEPKSKSISIFIKPAASDSTEIKTENGDKTITINTTAIEPKWPKTTEITLVQSIKDRTIVKDQDDVRKILVYSSMLNSLASKPKEREIVIDIKHWIEKDDKYEADVYVEAEISQSNIIRFTKGNEITSEQITEMNRCKVKVIENLDGTFTAIAESIPTIDIPLHVVII